MDRQDRLHLLIALVVVVLLGGAYWLMTAMHRNQQLEVCLMSRARNCERYGSP